ncbi:hydroxysqualene dehydroxylase HpnE [Verminephrobacter eiseniae]|uniref:hydroxysqualene dehydroxylase HpnE n=1 Tax=Verminephrobacter eiseniae TaxID=364317 RepID=UPI002237BCE0|nr:hydroxysqualene dehydroxylase HpnE [Verminephrobacter eiseniae]MCW5234873.1 FAD-binding protein [Verminephrobacter eiseniae]
MKVAVIGAGWAGMAAAIAHAQAGRRVTVFEAARRVGGRARAVPGTLPDGSAVTLDNGQHILIGAYRESLRLMRLVGVDTDAALLRLPLTLLFVDGQGLQLPDLPPPLDALLGIARAKGWHWRDKLALLRTAALWRLRGFRCAPPVSVAQLCARLTPRLMADFMAPLCVSALNTPVHAASGQVFLRVLQDSLFSGRGGSNLLLPRTDLGALFPQAAAHWLRRHGGQIITGQRVCGLLPSADAGWQISGGGAVAPERFEHVTLACPPWEARRLVAGIARLDAAGQRAARCWSAAADGLRFAAIATVYVHAAGVRLPQPMLALRSTAEQPAQFVFDRGWLGGPPGLLAFVVSASDGERASIERQVLQQAGATLARWTSGVQPPLRLVQTVLEKRATFACTPGLQRPGMQVLPGLSACGDYVQGPYPVYPATLEGAVLSGSAAAAQARPTPAWR